MRTAFLLLALATVVSAAPPLQFSVRREPRVVTISTATAPPGAHVELRLFSDRNQTISKFSDVSPLNPDKRPTAQKRDAETWYPIVDIDPPTGTEAVVQFTGAPAGFYSWNGWIQPVKHLLSPTLVIPAKQLEHWENSLWIEPAAPRIAKFYLRIPWPASNTLRIPLLSEQWTGTAVLHDTLKELALSPLPLPADFAKRIKLARELQSPMDRLGQTRSELSHDRLQQALLRTLEFTLRSQNKSPTSPTRGGLHVFYDLDARTFRSSHWIWGWGPSMSLLLNAAQLPEITARIDAKILLRTADEIGQASLRFTNDPALPGMPISRWERHSDYEYGHRGAMTPADAGFLMGWGWMPLYRTTHNPAYLDASRRAAAVMTHLTKQFGVTPQNLWLDNNTWGDGLIDESGFGTEGYAALYAETKNEQYREEGRAYMRQMLAHLERPDGLWDRNWSRGRNARTPTARMTRGLGWAMEGLLASHRLDPQGGYLARARKMADQLIAAQQSNGSFAFQFDQPVAQVGISEKGTALWSLLLYHLYHATADVRYREAARKALLWCIDNKYNGLDLEAQGSIVGVSPHSAVGYRPWFRVSCVYTSAFFGLAILEELKLP